jgi:predicted DNA binding CopG/RHH family protein
MDGRYLPSDQGLGLPLDIAEFKINLKMRNGFENEKIENWDDPVFNARAPTSLIDAVKAKAATRNVAYSVIVREAL